MDEGLELLVELVDVGVGGDEHPGSIAVAADESVRGAGDPFSTSAKSWII